MTHHRSGQGCFDGCAVARRRGDATPRDARRNPCAPRRTNAISRALRGLRFTAVLLVLSLGVSTEPHAQPQSPSETPAAELPNSQLSARAQALADRLEAIEAQQPAKALAQLEPQIEELWSKAAVSAERIEAVLSGPANPIEVEGQATLWMELERRFQALTNQIRTEADTLEETLAEVDEQTEIWKRTRAEARKSQAPGAVLEVVERAIAELAKARKQLADDLSSAIELLERAYDAELERRPMRERLDATLVELAAGLWIRQDEPVWNSLPTREEIGAVPAEIAARIAAVWQDLVPEVGKHRTAIVAQGVIFLYLAWLLSKARNARARLEPDTRDEGGDALRHPWAAAYLTSVLMMPLLQLDAVRVFQLVATPVALWAWYRVVSGIATPTLRVPLVVLALIAIPELFRFVLPGMPIVSRLLLVVDLALALAGLFWLRRPERLGSIPGRAIASPWLRLLNAWMSLLIPVVVVGLLASLLGYAMLAGHIALFAVWGTVLGAAWAALVRIAEETLHDFLGTGGAGLLRMGRSSRAAVMIWLQRGLRATGLFSWIYATLALAGFWGATRSALATVLSFSMGYGSVSVSLGSLIAFFVTLWLSWLLARFTSFTLDQEVFSRVRTAPGVSFALSTFARYSILVFGFLVAMGAIGFSLDRVALLLSALGVGIGFGLQNVVSNFVSGVILLFERPIRVGDCIQLDVLIGIVRTIGIRSSTVRTFDGADVLVPNSDLIAAQVTNWTLSDRKRRVVLPVGVAYGTSPRLALETLAEAARSVPDVLEHPELIVIFRGFGDSSLDFEIRAWTEADWIIVRSEIAVAAVEALEAAGITIPFPQRDLHLCNLDELRDVMQTGDPSLLPA